MALSVVAIKTAKGRAKPYKLTDSDGPTCCGAQWRTLLAAEWADFDFDKAI